MYVKKNVDHKDLSVARALRKGLNSEGDAAVTILTITAAHAVSVHTQILDA